MNSTAHKITENGRRRINVSQNGKVNMTLVVEWKSLDIPPQGVLVFSIEGDPGRNNVKDLSGTRRVWMTNGRPPFFHMDVSGLPVGAEFIVHVW